MSETDKIIENLRKSGRKVEEFYTGNKTSDKNVGSIDEKAVNDDIELIKNLIENNKIEIKNVSVGQEFRLLRTLQNILAEREQDKARTQELEEQVKTLDEAYTGTIKESKKWYDIAHNSIPKQVVMDKIKENKQILDKTNNGNLRERLYIENGIMKELLQEEENDANKL